jgi:hypothetical protein
MAAMDPRANQKRRSPWQEGGDSHSKFCAQKIFTLQAVPLIEHSQNIINFVDPM